MEKNIINDLKIPEFQNHKLTPRNPACIAIDTTRLWVEILWWITNADTEVKESDYASKILIDWKYSLIMRYKREKDGKTYPACTLSFNQEDSWNICINQLQWTKTKVSFRFNSSFNTVSYYLKLIEESFTKKWIFVYVTDFPEGLEWASYWSNAINNYIKLKNWISILNQKYWLKPN